MHTDTENIMKQALTLNKEDYDELVRMLQAINDSRNTLAEELYNYSDFMKRVRPNKLHGLSIATNRSIDTVYRTLRSLEDDFTILGSLWLYTKTGKYSDLSPKLDDQVLCKVSTVITNKEEK